MSAKQTESASHEVFSPQQRVRPSSRNLTNLTEDDDNYCVLHCTLPPGAIVPMHSHADRETFYVLNGRADAFRGDRWETLGPGDLFDAQDGIRHAWRNSSGAPVSMLCVTTMRMGRFLRDIAVDPRDSASAGRFLALVQEHGYWLASAEENAAIGLAVSWDSRAEGEKVHDRP